MALTTTAITYTSSIDAISLAGTVIYTTGATNLPILIAMHSYGTSVSNGFDTAARERLAQGVYYHIGAVTGHFHDGEAITGSVAGSATLNEWGPGIVIPSSVVAAFEVGEVITGAGGGSATITSIDNTQAFVIFPEMRGRGLSAGDEDSGGIEIQDIKDALDYILTTYPDETDATQIYIVGWSGGGGNVLSCLARFPDTFNGGVDFFGIGDYGQNLTSGWYQTTPAYQATMDSWIGGSPTAYQARYHARASVEAITNYSAGHLWMYHGYYDIAVPVAQSRNVRDALRGANYTGLVYSETGAASDPYWDHANPIAGWSVIQAEPDFMVPITAKTFPAWTVPAAGGLSVPGWVDTKRFSLWLGTGLDEYGRVGYNVNTRQFTITTATGAAYWTLKLKGQTPESSITAYINGVKYTEDSDADGVVTYTDTVIRNKYLPMVMVGRGGL